MVVVIWPHVCGLEGKKQKYKKNKKARRPQGYTTIFVVVVLSKIKITTTKTRFVSISIIRVLSYFNYFFNDFKMLIINTKIGGIWGAGFDCRNMLRGLEIFQVFQRIQLKKYKPEKRRNCAGRSHHLSFQVFVFK